MKKVFYTGLTESEIDSIKTMMCYLCKREDESASIIFDAGEPEIQTLKLKKSGFENPQMKFEYRLCEECLILLTAFSDEDEVRVLD